VYVVSFCEVKLSVEQFHIGHGDLVLVVNVALLSRLGPDKVRNVLLWTVVSIRKHLLVFEVLHPRLNFLHGVAETKGQLFVGTRHVRMDVLLALF
jgi:hypothetical protein